MAEENQAQEADNKSAKSGGGGGMLPALLVIVLMPVISFAMFKFLFLPELKKNIPETSGAVEHAEIDPANVHVETGEKYNAIFPDVITNVSGTGMARFIRVSLTIESSNPDIEKEVEANMAAMKDLVDTVLRHFTLADLEQREIKNVIRNQIIQGFDRVLQPPMVDDIYFSQFVVQ